MRYSDVQQAWEGAMGQSHRLGVHVLHVVAITMFSVYVCVVLVVDGHVVVLAVVVVRGVVVVCG